MSKVVSPKKPDVSSHTVDSICEKLMSELVKDTYDSLKESLNKTMTKDTKKEANVDGNDKVEKDSNERSNKIIGQEYASSFEESSRTKSLSKSEDSKSKTFSSHGTERSASREGLAKSRPQDMMLTFDLSSESSSEGMTMFYSHIEKFSKYFSGIIEIVFKS